MKKLSILIIGWFAWMMVQPVSAQETARHFSPQQFIKEMESFIAKEACFCPAESDAFFPIFHELHNKQRSINWKIMELKRHRLPPTATDKEYKDRINEINKLKAELTELEATYQEKMCKAIPAKKVYAAILAEDKYHRHVLQNVSNPSERNGRGNNKKR